MNGRNYTRTSNVVNECIVCAREWRKDCLRFITHPIDCAKTVLSFCFVSFSTLMQICCHCQIAFCVTYAFDWVECIIVVRNLYWFCVYFYVCDQRWCLTVHRKIHTELTLQIPPKNNTVCPVEYSTEFDLTVVACLRVRVWNFTFNFKFICCVLFYFSLISFLLPFCQYNYVHFHAILSRSYICCLQCQQPPVWIFHAIVWSMNLNQWKKRFKFCDYNRSFSCVRFRFG